MLIDFHTHIFPPELAPKAVKSLKKLVKKESGIDAVNYTNAAYDGLLRSMDENGVSKSIVMPVVTDPKKSESVNAYAKTVRGDRIISFAGVHPMQEEAVETVKWAKANGFMGIKIHPEFQRCFIDGKECMSLLKAAEEAELLVMLHAGADIGMPPPIHCTPKRLKNALFELRGDNIIAAHLGGWKAWDEVEEYLAGTPIYMDTAFINGYIDPKQCSRIIKKHGADKILFGSDSPWEDQKEAENFLMSLRLSENELKKIKYENAMRLIMKYSKT